MVSFDPGSWSPWIWFLHGLGALYVLGFVVEFFRIGRLAKRADAGGAEDLERYDRGIRGFPHAFYAKMLGHAPRR